ncbi:efflux RND transporter permease subunit [Marinilabiliaceae bacterium JC017]|nr:efflux RND transporter permease subunit [Marinilabiliaceae bacterium JC017]
MSRKIGIIGNAMRHYKLTILFICVLTLVGVVSLIVMPKQEFPDIVIRQGLVVGVYPGATSAEVEEQLTKPLEEFLFTFKEVKRKFTYSKSRDGVVYIMVMLEDDVTNKDEVWSKIKHGLTLLKPSLPSGVLAVVANDDFGDTSTILLSMESETKTYRELKFYMEELEGKLRRIPAISNLRRYGEQKEQIAVYLQNDKLAAYGLSRKMIATTLFSQGINLSGGSIGDERVDLPLHVAPSYNSEYEVAQQIIYTDAEGNVIRLKDVADIVREYQESDSYVTYNGRKSLILSLEMRAGENVVQFGKDVDDVLNPFKEKMPKDISLARIVDQPQLVNGSVNSFLRDLFLSIVVVIIVMMFLFPFRSAVVSAISIPISIFISIGVMYMCGIPINTVTLAALVVVLGMLVDNSIIVVDAYLERIGQGMSRWNAAIVSSKQYFPSIALATLCISTIFYPVLITATGIIYDFVFFFPFTITITLAVSLAVAMLFTPYAEYLLIRKGLNTNKSDKGFNLLGSVQSGYEKIQNVAFRFPKTTIAISIASVFCAVIIMSRMNMRMLPIADRDQFAVEIYLPHGTALDKTGEVCDSLYHILSKDKRIKFVTSFVGSASPRFQATYTPNYPGENYAQFIVNTVSVDATEEVLDEYADKYANYFPEAYVRFKQLDYQVTYTPLEVRFRGDDMASVKRVGEQLVAELQKVEGLTWIHSSFEGAQPYVKTELDLVKASQLGITRMGLATDLALNYTGLSLGELWEGDYSLPIHLKSGNAGNNSSFNKVADQYVSTGMPTVSVPLRQVATVTPDWQDGQIVRWNGIRTLSVYASMKRGYMEGKMFTAIRKVMDEKIIPQMPDGVEFEYGGAYEIDNEIMPPIVKGILGALCVIFIFLLLNFKKLSISLVALLSLSLSLFGVAAGLLVAGMDIGITCVLGIISLMGIAVRNAIIMFEHAEDLHLKKGFSAKDAAFDAGKRRMLPIFLTSATTAVGVIPMILSGSSLWGPMGVVIFAGTIVSTILIVTALPVVYWKIYGDK